METKAVAGWVLDQILVLLHPFMPFVTGEVWHALATREHDLIVAQWPMADARAIDPAAVAEIEWLIRLVQEVRTTRSELNVPPGAYLSTSINGADHSTKRRLASHAHGALQRVARMKDLALIEGDMEVGSSAQVVVEGVTYALHLEGVIDLAAERVRLAKGAEAAEKEAASLAGRLNNPAFVEKAKPEAVAKAREDHAVKAAEAERLQAALARLG